MGSRVSVSFKDDAGKESVAIFAHWGGKEFHTTAKSYLERLKKDIQEGKVERMTPLGRLESSRVITDFVRYLTKNEERVDSNYYLGKDEKDGDNSDHGHKCLLTN